jgi:hypothetical protein
MVYPGLPFCRPREKARQDKLIFSLKIVTKTGDGICGAYRYCLKSNLGHTAEEFFLQRAPHDRNLLQGELLSHSKSFWFFKGRDPLKKVKNNAKM